MYSKSYHLTDDTNITLSDSSQEILTKRMNFDLRRLSVWLIANKFSLNIEKVEFFVYQRPNSTLNDSFKIKLNRKRLIPTTSVKHLGIILDEELT